MTIRSLLYVVTITLLIAASPSLAQAQGVITVRLSYKVVLNPANGSRPTGPGGGTVTNANIDAAIAAMNTLHETYFRGFRFQRVDPITNVGGLGDTTGPSIWFNTNFFAPGGGAQKDLMEAAAMSDPRYAWNDDAINIYITNGICGGICSFPGGSDNIIIIGGCAANSGPLHLHEIGQ